MHNTNTESAVSGPINLLKHYSFESNYHSYERVLDSWLERFPLSWVNLALVESLYQGRYKVVSVEQILTLWQRRGKASYHFNHDFERLVSNNLPQTFEKKGVRKPPKNIKNFHGISSRPSSQKVWLHGQPQTPLQGNSAAKKAPGNPLLAHFQSDLEQSEKLQVVPQNKSSLPVELPLSQSSSSQKPELTEVESPSLNFPSAEEPKTEATKPPTIAIEHTPELIDSTIASDQQPLGTLSEESSNDDSQSNSSVPFSASFGETLNPIHQFVPQSSSTEFCSKLTAMAQVNV